MKLRHKFSNREFVKLELNWQKYIAENNEKLFCGDYCIYCGLIVDRIIEGMFVQYDDNIENYNYINEKYSCITEDEYAIKKLLE